MEGIPGVVGGGLRMNAGAMGRKLSRTWRAFVILIPKGNPHVKNRDELKVFLPAIPVAGELILRFRATFHAQPD